jgi:hypothetical protein
MAKKKIDLRNKAIEVLDYEHGQLVKKFFKENGVNVSKFKFTNTKSLKNNRRFYFVDENNDVNTCYLDDLIQFRLELIELPNYKNTEEEVDFNYDPNDFSFLPIINNKDYSVTAKLFDKTIEETISQLQETLLVKGKEYRRNGNPFHNFEEGARKENKTREEVLHGFALKHEISISDMRNDLSKGIMPKVEQVNEKFNDLIIYLLIEKASILDKLQLKNTENEN